MTKDYVPWPGERLLLKVTPPATVTPTPTPITPTPTPSPTLPSTPTPTLLPSPTSTATPEATLLGVGGTGFNPLWLIPMVIILGGGGYMALHLAHKKRTANLPSEQTPPDDDSAKVNQE